MQWHTGEIRAVRADAQDDERELCRWCATHAVSEHTVIAGKLVTPEALLAYDLIYDLFLDRDLAELYALIFARDVVRHFPKGRWVIDSGTILSYLSVTTEEEALIYNAALSLCGREPRG